MKLPTAPDKYDQRDQRSMRIELEKQDRVNVKKNEEWNPVRLVLTDTVTGARYELTSASGALTLTLVP